MRLYGHGSPAFLAHVREFATTEPLTDPTTHLGSEDTLLVDLETEGPLTVAAAIALGIRDKARVIGVVSPQAMPLAVEAVKQGATAILLKPLSADDLSAFAVVERTDPAAELARWRKDCAPEIVGESPGLLEALQVAMQAADFDCPVLIGGESGTGKELVAQALHRGSRRRQQPFIAVNCPAIPKELVESELFGHAKGAFTGATLARIGRFTAAHGGTLFLDEIGEMDLAIQSKLLRVLQDYHVTPVGESRSQQVDVRVIAASNRDLEQTVAAGQFRADLLYRLNVIQIRMPALRERRSDIPTLVQHLIERLSQERGVDPPRLSQAVFDTLFAYNWPGNIRELRNLIDRLVILRRGAGVEISDLPAAFKRRVRRFTAELVQSLELPGDGIDLRRTLQRFEDTMIRKALSATQGNRNQAAKILGLNRTTLVEKLRKSPLEDGEPDEGSRAGEGGISADVTGEADV